MVSPLDSVPVSLKFLHGRLELMTASDLTGVLSARHRNLWNTLQDSPIMASLPLAVPRTICALAASCENGVTSNAKFRLNVTRDGRILVASSFQGGSLTILDSHLDVKDQKYLTTMDGSSVFSDFESLFSTPLHLYVLMNKPRYGQLHRFSLSDFSSEQIVKVPTRPRNDITWKNPRTFALEQILGTDSYVMVGGRQTSEPTRRDDAPSYRLLTLDPQKPTTSLKEVIPPDEIFGIVPYNGSFYHVGWKVTSPHNASRKLLREPHPVVARLDVISGSSDVIATLPDYEWNMPTAVIDKAGVLYLGGTVNRGGHSENVVEAVDLKLGQNLGTVPVAANFVSAVSYRDDSLVSLSLFTDQTDATHLVIARYRIVRSL